MGILDSTAVEVSSEDGQANDFTDEEFFVYSDIAEESIANIFGPGGDP